MVSTRQPNITFAETLDGVNEENCVILGRENPVCGKLAYPTRIKGAQK